MGNRTGLCYLCREIKPLTFEHVPPQRVGNNGPAIAHSMDALRLPLHKRTGLPAALKFRQGIGVTTLCEQCNGGTGNEYGFAFWQFVNQASEYAGNYRQNSGKESVILLPFQIEPLRVLKQIVTMLMAVALPALQDQQHGLRRFALQPFQQMFPNDYAVRLYMNPVREGHPMTQNRVNRQITTLDVVTGRSTFKLAEVAFPPLGYALICDLNTRQHEHDEGMADISYFSRYRLGQFATVWLQMPIQIPFGPANHV